MKRIKRAIKEECAETTVISSTKYYGYNNGGQRGFITRQDYKDGSYVARCLTMLTEGNGWSSSRYTDLASFINSLVANGWVVYEFATWRELAIWLIEEKEF